MLTKPNLPDDALLTCVRESYGVTATRLEFLPLGADYAAWHYRVDADDGQAYFLKLRTGSVDEVSLLVPRYLNATGAAPVVAPASSQSSTI